VSSSSKNPTQDSIPAEEVYSFLVEKYAKPPTFSWEFRAAQTHAVNAFLAHVLPVKHRFNFYTLLLSRITIPFSLLLGLFYALYLPFAFADEGIGFVRHVNGIVFAVGILVVSVLLESRTEVYRKFRKVVRRATIHNLDTEHICWLIENYYQDPTVALQILEEFLSSEEFCNTDHYTHVQKPYTNSIWENFPAVSQTLKTATVSPPSLQSSKQFT